MDNKYASGFTQANSELVDGTPVSNFYFCVHDYTNIKETTEI